MALKVICLSQLVSAHPEYVILRLYGIGKGVVVRTARIQLGSRQLSDNWFHVDGVHRRLRNEIMGGMTAEDYFDNLDWLYGHNEAKAVDALMTVVVDKTGILDDLRGAPGHLMRRGQQIAVSVFLDECRPWDLTPLQFAVLASFTGTDRTIRSVSVALLYLDRTTINVVVKKLKKGLVERCVSEKDRRSKPVSITRKGANLIREVLPAAEAAQDRM